MAAIGDNGARGKRHVVRISDGLGNQMFQYAFAYALQKRTGEKVYIDPFFFKNGLRAYQLENYNIGMERFVSVGLDYLLGFGPRDGGYLKKRYRDYVIKHNFDIVCEKGFMHYDGSILHPVHDSFYDGFWQVPAYFDDLYDEIRKEFARITEVSSAAASLIEQVKRENSVSLHIRRTDYIGEDYDSSLNFDFYRESLKEAGRQLGDFRLYVFSDDKPFVMDHFDIMPYELVDGLTDIDEFEVMRNCRNHILANSTFSWWAAYLGENKGGIVFAPSVTCWRNEYYPNEWHTIETDLIKPR